MRHLAAARYFEALGDDELAAGTGSVKALRKTGAQTEDATPDRVAHIAAYAT